MKIFMPFQHFLTFWCCRKARSQIYQDFSQQSDMNSLSANKQYYNWNEASWLVAELCLWLCSHVGRAMILQLRLDKHSYPTYFTLNKTNGGRGNILFCDYLCQGHLNIDPPLPPPDSDAAARDGWLCLIHLLPVQRDETWVDPEHTHKHTVFTITNIMYV